MSRTIAVHVCYNFLHISLPSSAKQQREMAKSALSGELELRRLIFWNSFSNLSWCPRFSFVITLTIINKRQKDLRVSRDSLVKYQLIFNRRCLLRRRSNFLNSLLGQFQTPYFTRWAESNANKKNPLFSHICIRFGSCQVRRLNFVLKLPKI